MHCSGDWTSKFESVESQDTYRTHFPHKITRPSIKLGGLWVPIQVVLSPQGGEFQLFTHFCYSIRVLISFLEMLAFLFKSRDLGRHRISRLARRENTLGMTEMLRRGDLGRCLKRSNSDKMVPQSCQNLKPKLRRHRKINWSRGFRRRGVAPLLSQRTSGTLEKAGPTQPKSLQMYGKV